METVNPLFY